MFCGKVGLTIAYILQQKQLLKKKMPMRDIHANSFRHFSGTFSERNLYNFEHKRCISPKNHQSPKKFQNIFFCAVKQLGTAKCNAKTVRSLCVSFFVTFAKEYFAKKLFFV